MQLVCLAVKSRKHVSPAAAGAAVAAAAAAAAAVAVARDSRPFDRSLGEATYTRDRPKR